MPDCVPVRMRCPVGSHYSHHGGGVAQRARTDTDRRPGESAAAQFDGHHVVVGPQQVVTPQIGLRREQSTG
jgi:hypothetical protein